MAPYHNAGSGGDLQECDTIQVLPSSQLFQDLDASGLRRHGLTEWHRIDFNCTADVWKTNSVLKTK